MTDDSEITDRVIAYVKKTARPKKGHAITSDSEIYCDLQVYGTDLFELALWAQKEFGVVPNLKLSDYAPGEGVFLPFIRLTDRIFGPKKYRSLMVSDVVAAIKEGRWRDTEC
jgi:hypothetical protein